jgi:hypothetical protein
MDLSKLQNPNLKLLLYCKSKWYNKAKKMRVGAREGFANHPVKLVLLANGNRHEVASNTVFFIQVVELIIHSKCYTDVSTQTC